jgi:hypothetical protein
MKTRLIRGVSAARQVGEFISDFARPSFGTLREDPEGPIDRSDPRLGSLQGECGELLTQGEFNKRLLLSVSKEGRKGSGGGASQT